MLVCIVDKQEYKNALIKRKYGNSVEDLKYVCIGSIHELSEAYAMANHLPCLSEVIVEKGIIPICLILANP